MLRIPPSQPRKFSWQTFWSPKGNGKPDGCLTLVRPDITVSNYETHHYHDDSGHIAQVIEIGSIAFANTHIKWAPAETPDHIGVAQVSELFGKLAL